MLVMMQSTREMKGFLSDDDEDRVVQSGRRRKKARIVCSRACTAYPYLIYHLTMWRKFSPPRIKDFLWQANAFLLLYTQGLLLHHNRSGGVILSNQSLVLQKVSRPSAGNYSCRASNAQGEGTSNHVLLDIMCKFFTYIWNVELFYY